MENKKSIALPIPDWNSKLVSVVLDLDNLRNKRLYGQIPPHIFYQLKNTFQILETLGSARIEGNNTTLSERVEKVISKEGSTARVDEKDREVSNLEDAMNFIEENTDENTLIDRAYISQLHKIIVKNLSLPANGGEGSKNPGVLRMEDVTILKSNHIPPNYIVLPEYFEEYIKFINKPQMGQNQLLMVAVAHHRFAYIHPFDNGNGRLGRLLTYSLLIKSGFRVKQGRIINPSSVFYSNRDKYYEMLGVADSLTNSDIASWCEYFLEGLKNEITKIDTLLDENYVKNKILIPAINFTFKRKIINDKEQKILTFLVNRKGLEMKAADLGDIGITSSTEKTRALLPLRKLNLIHPVLEGGRVYTINFMNNYLLRGIIISLQEEGFVSEFLENN